ncbi:MAG: hypothetical protein GY760_03535, partial [Deltaproteobacteria bacterium]|nr:hypothetical protein [Deltaproteobacteria bacterium]
YKDHLIHLTTHDTRLPNLIGLINDLKHKYNQPKYLEVPGLKLNNTGIPTDILLEGKKHRCYLQKQVSIPGLSIIPVNVIIPNFNGKVGDILYFSPNARLAKKRELAGIEGVISYSGNSLNTINLINGSEFDIQLGSGRLVGNVEKGIVQKENLEIKKSGWSVFEKLKFIKQKFEVDK